jgi:hypothetical protein
MLAQHFGFNSLESSGGVRRNFEFDWPFSFFYVRTVKKCGHEKLVKVYIVLKRIRFYVLLTRKNNIREMFCRPCDFVRSMTIICSME